MANEGPCDTPKPGFFDFQGKQKWEAWKGLGNMSRAQARQGYVQLLSKACPDWEEKVHSKEGKVSSSLGVSVSVMANTEVAIDDELKTIFDWCKEGNTKQVAKLLEQNKEMVDSKDSEGMVLLHWAADRGDNDMVKTLLTYGASVNIQDADEQTALHYAVGCEHCEVIHTLLAAKAKTDVPDKDGCTVLYLMQDSNSEVKQIFNNYEHTVT
ncbi:acyl-CoA-binding domain-containing protein 6-like isoform X2 [Dreissena polymorpha]|uniref:acyl-CoA-binding domain-containing protein 6-like isoform X2 n=1 Tax=Dreissena polymorpha TaxID=45954 RepID=UPI0022647807|nr:acyl-CoA-binding domain-containing protein 6-like isoform X2 [Dreissena polymorpha]